MRINARKIPRAGYDPEYSDVLDKNGTLYYFDELFDQWMLIPSSGITINKLKKMESEMPDSTHTALLNQNLDRDAKPGRHEIKAWIKWHKDRGLNPRTGEPAKSRGQLKREARKRAEERKQMLKERKEKQNSV